MKKLWTAFNCAVIAAMVLAPAALLLAPEGASAKGDEPEGYQTAFMLWRGQAGGFDGWSLDGVQVAGFSLPGQPAIGPALMLDSASLHTAVDEAGAYNGGNYYNGGAYDWGEAVSPELTTEFAFEQAIASWNALTPAGTWIETSVRARLGEQWTKWYSLGVWASSEETVRRHSVNLQGDSDGYVAVDTLVMAKGKLPAQALQVKVRLMRAQNAGASPNVNSISLAYATAAPKKAALSAGSPANWNVLLNVPECSQMVYPDGGNVWCSPTSVSMVLGYWGIDSGPCEPSVRAAVAGVYDWVYDGHGNWPFNTAYAASRSLPEGGRMEGYVARYASLDRLEAWVKAGVPVVMSIAWGKNELSGAAIPASNGHLVVLVGFDADGNPIVNDPAAGSDEAVQRTYLRAELESVWQLNSGGTVYLIFPEGHATPDF